MVCSSSLFRVIPVLISYRHAWISYMVDKPPVSDPILQTGVRAWEPKGHSPVLTMSRSAYKPYSTTKSKYFQWTPVAKERQWEGSKKYWIDCKYMETRRCQSKESLFDSTSWSSESVSFVDFSLHVNIGHYSFMVLLRAMKIAFCVISISGPLSTVIPFCSWALDRIGCAANERYYRRNACLDPTLEIRRNTQVHITRIQAHNDQVAWTTALVG